MLNRILTKLGFNRVSRLRAKRSKAVHVFEAVKAKLVSLNEEIMEAINDHRIEVHALSVQIRTYEEEISDMQTETAKNSETIKRLDNLI